MGESLSIFTGHPVETAIVIVKGLILVSTVPDRNELNELIGTTGGGPFGLPPSDDTLMRVRSMLRSTPLTAFVSVELVMILFIWVGVGRVIIRSERKSVGEAWALYIPLLFAITMLLSGSPVGHARLRVPAMPALAMLAGVGWLGRSKKIVDEAYAHQNQSLPHQSVKFRPAAS